MLTAFILATTATAPLRIVEQIDPISDARSVYAVTAGPESSLAMGCSVKGDPSTARVVIHFDHYIGDATPGLILGGRDLIYRFDQRQPQAVQWGSHERDVFAERESARPVKFMLSMKGSTTLNLRVTDQLGDPRDLAFSYPEPTAVIDSVLRQCGFTPDGHVAKAPAR